jgi:hypothetical protein
VKFLYQDIVEGPNVFPVFSMHCPTLNRTLLLITGVAFMVLTVMSFYWAGRDICFLVPASQQSLARSVVVTRRIYGLRGLM